MKLPGVLLVGGTDEHRSRIFVRDFILKSQKEGYTIQPLDGSDHNGLVTLISTVGVLFPNPTVAVITNPEKVRLTDVADHMKDPNQSLVLLLVSDSDKPGGWLADVPQAQTKMFTLPPFYKLDGHAADYACSLTKKLGLTLSESLAQALVRKVGNDLGVVSFEVSKVAMLARALGVTTIEPEHLRGTLASLSELDGSLVVDALGVRNARAVSEELGRYKGSKKGDPTIELCGRSLTPTVLRWLQAAYFHSKGVAPAGAAGRVGASPWYWEHKVLPSARNWGVDGCRDLLRVIARAQCAVFEGAISPWASLEANLVRLANAN